MDDSVVPFADLAALHHPLRFELLAAAERVIDRGWFVLGDEVATFEAQWASACGSSFAVGVGTGLDALTLSLEALGIGPGDEVLVPSNTYIATWLAVSAVGATPAPVEPDPITHLMTPTAAEAAIGSRTAAILPVHLYGRPVDVDGFEELATRHGLALVFDAAQAHGATFDDRPLGGRGDATAWSFYPTKNLGALGDGGAIVTNDAALADKVKLLRNGGQRNRYLHEEFGVNSRLDEMQAAILRARLPLLAGWTARRRALAARYRTQLTGSSVTVPPECDPGHVYHLFPILSPDRDRLRADLAERGIETLIHYPISLPKQPAMAPTDPAACPIGARIADQVLSLPLHPQLSFDDLDRVAEAVTACAPK